MMLATTKISDASKVDSGYRVTFLRASICFFCVRVVHASHHAWVLLAGTPWKWRHGGLPERCNFLGEGEEWSSADGTRLGKHPDFGGKIGTTVEQEYGDRRESEGATLLRPVPSPPLPSPPCKLRHAQVV